MIRAPLPLVGGYPLIVVVVGYPLRVAQVPRASPNNLTHQTPFFSLVVARFGISWPLRSYSYLNLQFELSQIGLLNWSTHCKVS